MADKLAELERRVSGHDKDVQALLGEIHRLMDAPASEATTVEGFRAGER